VVQFRQRLVDVLTLFVQAFLDVVQDLVTDVFVVGKTGVDGLGGLGEGNL
jgi:hypothetical protein